MLEARKDSTLPVLAAVVFSCLFLILNKSTLADITRIKFIYSQMVIPVRQWGAILVFTVLWRFLAGERWKAALAKGAALGLGLCLYLPMLDTQFKVWNGSPLSRVYVLYVNVFVFLITTALISAGSFSLVNLLPGKRAYPGALLSDAIFLPLYITAVYGAYFYVISGKLVAGAALSVFLIACPAAIRAGQAVSKIAGVIKSVFAYLTNYRRLALIIMVFSLILRLVFLFNLLSKEGDRYPLTSDDGDTYDAWGWNGVTDPMNYIKKSPHYFFVFYAVFLTGVYRVFGHSYIAAGVIQSVIGALFCALIFAFAYRITKNKLAAFLAGLGAAVDSTLIFLFTTLNTEVLYMPLLLVSVMLLLFYRETETDAKAAGLLALSGVILGLATIIRTPAIGLIVFIIPWIFIWGRPYAGKRGLPRLRDALIVSAAAILAIIPITITNYVNTGKFYLVYDTTNSVEWRATIKEEDTVPSNKKFIELGMTDPINNPGGSLAALLKRPKEFMRAGWEIIPKRMRNLFFMPNFGYFDPIFLMNPARAPNRFASHLLFYSVLLFVVSVLMFIFSSIEPYLKGLTLLVVAYYSLLHGVLFLCVGPRYGAPMKPFLDIVISLGLIKIISVMADSAGSKK